MLQDTGLHGETSIHHELAHLAELRSVAPGWVDATRALYAGAASPAALAEHERELVLLAIELAATSLRPGAAAVQAQRACDAGASREQVLATAQLASVLGLHSLSWGLPRLADLLAERDQTLPDAASTADLRYRGEPLDPTTAAMAAADRRHFEAINASVAPPWQEGALGERLAHLVCIAIDATASHLYPDGFDRHVRGALDGGATAAEIVAVLQLCSLAGLRSVVAAVDAVAALDLHIDQTSAKENNT